MKERKGQITLFVIIAIVIIVILAIILYPRIKSTFSSASPQDYIKECTEKATEEALQTITLQGGSLNPENYVLYQGNKIEYICYTNKYYEKCVMQKPLLRQSIEQEINTYIQPKVEKCIGDLKQQLEKKGSVVTVGQVNVGTSLTKNFIFVDIDVPLTITDESTSSFTEFRVDIRSNLYDLVMIASSIANWEARYGDSNSLSYMLYYPNIRVEKLKQDEGSTIYSLTDKDTQDKFTFASRSIAWPPGTFGV